MLSIAKQHLSLDPAALVVHRHREPFTEVSFEAKRDAVVAYWIDHTTESKRSDDIASQRIAPHQRVEHRVHFQHDTVDHLFKGYLAASPASLHVSSSFFYRQRPFFVHYATDATCLCPICQGWYYMVDVCSCSLLLLSVLLSIFDFCFLHFVNPLHIL